MLKLTIEVEGKTESDLELGAEEALRRLKKTFTSGADSNETGRFSFNVSGQSEGEEE